MREREMGWDRQKREEKGEGEGGKIRGACANMTQYKPSKEKWIFQVWKSQKENCGKLWAFYDICSIRCSSGVNPEATCVLQFDYCETKFRTVFWKCDFNFKAQQGHRVLLVIVLPTWHNVNCTKLKYFQESSEDHWAHCKSLGPHRASKCKTCRVWCLTMVYIKKEKRKKGNHSYSYVFEFYFKAGRYVWLNYHFKTEIYRVQGVQNLNNFHGKSSWTDNVYQLFPSLLYLYQSYHHLYLSVF